MRRNVNDYKYIIVIYNPMKNLVLLSGYRTKKRCYAVHL